MASHDWDGKVAPHFNLALLVMVVGGAEVEFREPVHFPLNINIYPPRIKNADPFLLSAFQLGA